jgi:predicted N-acyltransferase
MQYEFSDSIRALAEAEWQAIWQSDYPFIQYRFLAALEDSRCAAVETGWQPYHLSLRDQGKLVAAMPLYLKSHSYGEYVFDWSWADAYHRNGIHYYPKLVNAIPFTPATGPRMAAVNPGYGERLMEALSEKLDQRGLSGFHALFPNADPTPIPNSLGMQRRLGCQFHWFNRNYEDFDDFLADFSSRKRKNIKKERQKVIDQNLKITATLGHELNDLDWQDFHKLYQRTYQKRSGHNGYLSSQFFSQTGASLKGNTFLVRAYSEQQLVGASLYFYDKETLYGRYWGALAEVDGLHFECCYYRGIEFAIAKGLKRFDPGAQGEHKIQRGFVPVLTQSFHRLNQPQFNNAVGDFLIEEQQGILKYCNDARGYLPFRAELELPAPEYLIGQLVMNSSYP